MVNMLADTTQHQFSVGKILSKAWLIAVLSHAISSTNQ
jgi:hypothetical protein